MNYFWQNITSRYFSFNGRASREEFWLFVFVMALINTLFIFVLSLAGAFSGTFGQFQDISKSEEMVSLVMNYSYSFAFLFFIFGLWLIYLVIPTLAATTRRLHDSNISGWWIAAYVALSTMASLWIVPSISAPVTFILFTGIFIFTLFRGDKTANRYGKVPVPVTE